MINTAICLRLKQIQEALNFNKLHSIQHSNSGNRNLEIFNDKETNRIVIKVCDSQGNSQTFMICMNDLVDKTLSELNNYELLNDGF